MAASNVRVEFMGLMGVVPNRPQPEAQPESYLIALPDLEFGLRDQRLPKCESDHGQAPMVVPPHVATVIVPADSVVAESHKRPAMRFRTYDGAFSGRDYLLYFLEGEHLELTPLASAPLDAPYRRVDPGSNVPQDAQDACGLQWIPQLSLANGANSRAAGKFARDRFLNADWTPRANEELELAGTMLIRNGRFCVEDVIRDQGKPIEFDFMVPTTTNVEWRQARYSRMLWDSAVEGNRLDMVFRGGGREAPGNVSLRAVDGRWDLWVANLELEALVGIGCKTPRNSRADLDFSVMYLFGSEVPDAKQGMPVPHDPERIGGSTPRCGSSLFDG